MTMKQKAIHRIKITSLGGALLAASLLNAPAAANAKDLVTAIVVASATPDRAILRTLPFRTRPILKPSICPQGWKVVRNETGNPSAFNHEMNKIITCKPVEPKPLVCPQEPRPTYPYYDSKTSELGCQTSVF